jgi:uncharacterized alkaline shock family protein YloU
MPENYRRQSQDTVTIHPQVLRAIVRTAALGVPGVLRLGGAARWDRWWPWEGPPEGVQVRFEGEALHLSVQLVVDANYALQAVCAHVQQELGSTLEKYVGLSPQSVNVYVVDVILKSNRKPSLVQNL